MIRRTFRPLALAVALLLLASTVVADDDFRREQDLSAKEGKPAPELTATGWMNTENGEPLTMKDLRGKVVVIDFWGTW